MSACDSGGKTPSALDQEMVELLVVDEIQLMAKCLGGDPPMEIVATPSTGNIVSTAPSRNSS